MNGVSGADGGGAPGDGPAVNERNEEAGRYVPGSEACTEVTIPKHSEGSEVTTGIPTADE